MVTEFKASKMDVVAQRYPHPNDPSRLIYQVLVLVEAGQAMNADRFRGTELMGIVDSATYYRAVLGKSEGNFETVEEALVNLMDRSADEVHKHFVETRVGGL